MERPSGRRTDEPLGAPRTAVPGGQQRADGSWVPLWFGNQDHPAEENPVYGTAKVLLAYAARRGRSIRRHSAASDGFAVLRTATAAGQAGSG
jgi:hypothetical protein